MKQSELVSVRDTLQSIWVAIILAFVLRAFMLEAFEIPTGSMAPRLMGRHALLTCPDCRYQFPRGLPDIAYESMSRYGGAGEAHCPNCGEKMGVRLDAAKSGDRVLVLKLPRMMRPLERWDVVVFKDVQGNSQNYIKRLVGLPGEVVRIIQGDVFTHRIVDGNRDDVRDEHDLDAALTDLTNWRIARKPQRTQDAMWQLLFDNDFQPAAGSRRREPWEPLWEVAQPGEGQWQIDLDAGRVFHYTGDGPRDLQFARGQAELFLPVNAYNSIRENSDAINAGVLCSDLKLETTLLPTTATGSMRLMLSSRRHEFAGEVCFDGRVRLLRRPVPERGEAETPWEDAEELIIEQLTPLKPGRAVSLALTHVDYRVTLWVNDEPALATTDKHYLPDLPALLAGEANSISMPPRVGISGVSGEFQLWHTRVLRDEFYTCPMFREDPSGLGGKYLADHFSDPARGAVAKNGHPGWGTQDNPVALRRFENRPDYDEFFMLGDNSPSSSDSRLWLKASPTLRLYDEMDAPQYRPGTVPRYNLIGKAFFVYWPAGTRLPGLKRLPLIPDVGKMRRIN